MRLSNAGCEYITGEEGIRLKAYQDQIGVWTIGVGHTGPEVEEGLAWSREKVMEVFRQDVKRFESCVNENVKIELSQCQFDALVSFSFNVGCGNFRSSTMLKLLNEGKISEAAEQFPRWNKAAGKVLPVLVRRREREKRLFLEGRYV